MYLVFSNSYPVLVCREAGLPSKIETLLWKKVFLASSRLRFWALLSIYFRVIPLIRDTTGIPLT